MRFRCRNRGSKPSWPPQTERLSRVLGPLRRSDPCSTLMVRGSGTLFPRVRRHRSAADVLRAASARHIGALAAGGPGGFPQFAIKCFQLVTHEVTSPTCRRSRRELPRPATVGSFRDTPAVRAAWDETVAAAKALGAKIVLLQTPASLRRTIEGRRSECSELR